MNIEMPDGTVAQFPDDMSRDEVRRAILERFPDAEKQAKKEDRTDTLSRTRVASGGMVEGIPIVGPLIRRGTEMAAAATLAPFSDKSYSEILEMIDEETEKERAANPVLDIGSQVAGSMMAMTPVAATATGAKALGITGKSVGRRIAASSATGAGISGADEVARGVVGDGVDARDVAGATVIGGTVSAAAPMIAEGGAAIWRKASGATRGVTNPADEASRVVGDAMEADRQAGQILLGADDVAAAAKNNQPIINADLGGETTRALARSAANQSPEARGAVEKMVSDRFADQSDRIVDQVTRAAGGNVDDIAARDFLLEAARKANDPAYKRAFSDPKASALYTPALQELMQSPSIRVAAKAVPKRSADRGAVEGFKEIANPFEVNSQGQYVLRKKADGSIVSPNLQFWDQVKRNLDGMIGKAERAGDKTVAADLVALKKKLTGELDKAVPSYKKARSGAASFFQAEDALEAGRKFARSTRSNPEFKRGLAMMKKPEREAFKIGYASELIDIARSSNDRVNTIRKMFMSPEAREKITMAFGKAEAREFEAFVRVENAMDMLRGAMGNSTTTRQLLETGLVGAGAGGSAWWITGDFSTGAVAALAAGAAGKKAGKKIHERVLKEVSNLLLSNDPKQIDRVIKRATVSRQHMAAVDAVTQVLVSGARGGINASGLTEQSE